ncbi:lipoprotein-related protein [Vibrio ishigakensis]|uniref:Lipoprotein-related protein n=1 Tax=Vibrio ishigakensis TaxID=1481914 RepID=A0A0B8QVF0_9VIBR|nr:lipoprotein-related protein [Vibrio ishigakensis]
MRKWLLVALFGITLAGCATQPTEQAQQGADQSASEQVKNDDMKATSEQQVGMREVSGTVAYRERIALPDNAVLKVTLEDVSLADAKAIVIDSQSYTTEASRYRYHLP